MANAIAVRGGAYGTRYFEASGASGGGRGVRRRSSRDGRLSEKQRTWPSEANEIYSVGVDKGNGKS